VRGLGIFCGSDRAGRIAPTGYVDLEMEFQFPVNDQSGRQYNLRMTKETYRRTAGAQLGAAVGLVFTGITQILPHVYLPGVPLYQPPFGVAGNILLGLLLGAAMGLICCWTDDSFIGVLVSGALGAAVVIGVTFSSDRMPFLNTGATVIGAIFLMLPFTAAACILTVLLRAAVNHLVSLRKAHRWSIERWWLPALVVIAAGLAGYWQVMPEDGRLVVTRAHTMLQQGLAADSTEDLPAPLAAARVTDFNGSASSGYSLAWENKGITRYAIPRPAGPDYLISVAVVRFDNGWNVVCLYPNTQAEPRCQSFEDLP